MGFKRILVVLLFLTGLPALLAKEPPAGILIIKSSPTAPDTQAGSIIEYQTITEHLIPATDYVTVTKPDGDRDDVPKNLIIRRVDYPRQLTRTIISAGGLNDTVLSLQELQRVVSNYPQTRKYLDSKIGVLQKEIDLFNLGARKINDVWISAEEFDNLLAREHARRMAILETKRRAEAEAAAIKQRAEEVRAEARRRAEEEAAAEAKRKAEEKAAQEAKIRAAALQKKQKAALLLAERNPPATLLSYIPWKTIIILLALGAGGIVALRKLKGQAGPTSLAALDWPKFELLVAEIYRRKGYTVEISSGFGSEEGLDMKLIRGEEVILVQSKHWEILKQYQIGAQEIMGLYQMVANEPGWQGIFVSSGEYRNDAREFVVDKPIQLKGVADIERMIPDVSRKNENLLNIKSWVAEFISHAKIVDPECPKCRKPMELKSDRSGVPVWRCPDFPNCDGKLDARADLVKGRVK